MEECLVSVIIPLYNTEKYISQCVESVIDQTYKNLEIIIIDDGSTDLSVEACQKFLFDKRIRLISRENRGLSFTRQEGIDLANGKYFCTLDADDYYKPTFVETLLKQAEKNSADVCVCGRVDFDEKSNTVVQLSCSKNYYKLNKTDIVENFDVLCEELCLSDAWNKLYKTEFVRNTTVRYSLDNTYNGTDLLFNHLLVLHCPSFYTVNEALLMHRIVDGSRVHRKNKPLQEGFGIIFEKIISEINKIGFSNKIYNCIRRRYVLLLNMVYDAILNESDSLKEFNVRYKGYLIKKREFETKNPKLKISMSDNVKYGKMHSFALINTNVIVANIEYLYKRRKRENCFEYKKYSG